ncbi:MAG: GNAT family N-acetyltransferase [Candidatus Hodarchaeales archaeon]|jgi:ribosomal protein S18 acetylase RimI-like enzyme
MIREYHGETRLREQLLQVLQAVDKDFFPPLSQRRPLEFWLNLFEKGVVLVTIEDDNVVGFLAYYPSLSGKILDELRTCVNIDPVISPANSNKVFQGAYLHFIAVSPEYRRRKLASDLLSALLKDAQEKGVSRLRVVTWSTNINSLKLYKNKGFQVFQQLPNDRACCIGSVYLEVKIPFPPDMNDYNILEESLIERGSL